jgi:hypothetical protein
MILNSGLTPDGSSWVSLISDSDTSKIRWWDYPYEPNKLWSVVVELVEETGLFCSAHTLTIIFWPDIRKNIIFIAFLDSS